MFRVCGGNPHTPFYTLNMFLTPHLIYWCINGQLKLSIVNLHILHVGVRPTPLLPFLEVIELLFIKRENPTGPTPFF